ncbi:DUF3887 domain-containing protein [Synechococcus sp. UW140]|uniref:DUF3887 domain-containing protein n=1 Tax=Synechococcus sp. UW140 TaxID=368503 RepID=UPI003137F6B4
MLRPWFLVFNAPALVLLLGGPFGSLQQNALAAEQSFRAIAALPAAKPATATKLSDKAAREATDAILSAIQQRDANKRFSQFSDELKQTSSPSMVLSTINSFPELTSWKITKVSSGMRNTIVKADLNTSTGKQAITLVLNNKGLLVAQLFDSKNQAATNVAEGFVKAISQGQFITARSYLSLDFQKELPPGALQRKWQELQRETGNFQRILKVTEAEHTATSRLVLVETSFNRLSDSLFVILNANNQIIGVDFPTDAQPKPVR